MRRIYTDVSTFRAPFDHVEFQGLGNWPSQWPAGRSYIDVAQHRMPYRSGYYQDNTLFGLGDPATDAMVAALKQGEIATLKRGRQQGFIAGIGVTFVLCAVLAGGIGALLAGPGKYQR